MREFESRGLWYLPTRPKDVVAGVLKYSLRDGLLLSLTGTLQEHVGGGTAPAYPLIHGLISDSPYGRLVTLVDCFQRLSTLAIPGFASEEIRANRAYIGSRHLTAEEQGIFVSVRATFAHLSEWSGLTGFKSRLADHPAPGVISATYRKPSPLELRIDNEPSAQIETSASAEQGHRRFQIDERVEFTLRSVSGRSPLEIVRARVAPFEDLLTFASDAPSSVEDIVLMAGPADDPIHQDSVHLVYQPMLQRQGRVAHMGHDMLFTWPDVSLSHPHLVRDWFRFRGEFKAACDVYFGYQYAPPAYLETKILLLHVALGLFLSNRHHNAPLSDAIASLRHALPTPRDLAWLEGIASIEEMSLPWGALKLIQDHSLLLVPALGDDAEQFVGKLMNTRHHLFHRDVPGPGLENKLQLLQLIERLTLLIKVRILECLGFSREELSALLSRNRRYLNLTARRLDGFE